MILEITAAAIGGGFVGYFACAMMTAGRSMDEQFDRWEAEAERDDAHKAHARATDALTTKQSRIDRALEQVTPGANATVLRIARILRGEA